MTQRLRATGYGLAVLLASRVFGLSPCTAPVVRHDVLLSASTAGVEPDVALPAGFAATVDRATTGLFVRVVAGDIDRDGDIDVVAIVGTLDLLVWTNDGAGHFTRVPSSRRPVFQAQPLPPSFDEGPFTSNEWIQNDDRDGARLARVNAVVDAAPPSALSARICPVVPQPGPRVRSSRAPPPALSL